MTCPNPALKLKTVGILLHTERFDQCVRFYRDCLCLPVWFEKEALVCLRFGEGYLMIETGGVASESAKKIAENPVVVRFNVDDVSAAADAMRTQGVVVAVEEFSWGTVGTFRDPDGNLCEFKNADDPFFNERVAHGE